MIGSSISPAHEASYQIVALAEEATGEGRTLER